MSDARKPLAGLARTWFLVHRVGVSGSPRNRPGFGQSPMKFREGNTTGHTSCLLPLADWEDLVIPRFRFRRLPDGTIGWMLLGGNNRLIGTAATGAPTPARAVSGAERARDIAATGALAFMVA